ncbi:MAG: hypothetical protein C0502_00925 [Opitutus sp.]|nr:hypothetical protein [Opitutus sp.]
MRFLALFLALASAASAASAADLRIVRVYSGWRDAGSFKRISEYFTGRENTGGEIVVRTHPEQRAGYYFLVRTRNTGAPFDGRFEFQVVLPNSPQPRAFRFPAAVPAGEAVFHLGVTGADWPDSKTGAVAWKLDLRNAAGEPLAAQQSYLWEKPSQ